MFVKFHMLYVFLPLWSEFKYENVRNLQREVGASLVLKANYERSVNIKVYFGAV